LKIVLIIPARFKSSRLPGKPLIKILNKELILWVLEACSKAINKKFIFVATDNNKIFKFVTNKGFNAIMTPINCLTGTDRVAYVAKKIHANIYINVQGDEPLIKNKDIELIIRNKIKFKDYVICGYADIHKKKDLINTNIPKIIMNDKNNLVYASRLPIPGYKDEINKIKIKYYKQVCIYAFNKLHLNKFLNYKKKSTLETFEDIEILRFLELNTKIKMIKINNQNLAVDVKEDIIKVENFILKKS
jgi:3-deoxy-manno-octulosonate cytidylyltransferase (CMP-KDO synthetase)